MTDRHSLLYLLHHRFPDTRAAAIFAAEEVKSLSAHVPVTVIVPLRNTTDLKEAQKQYQFSSRVTLIGLPVIELSTVPLLRRIAFHASLLSYTLGLVWVLYRHPAQRVLTVDHLPALVALWCGKEVCIEIHDPPRRYNPIWRLLLSRVPHVLATNSTKVDELVQLGVPRKRIFVEPNGVNLVQFAPRDRAQARQMLNLPQTACIVLYTGTLYAWKGVETLIAAARIFPTCEVYLVGGASRDIARLQSTAPQTVHFLPPVPHDEMPVWQSAADILVLPNTGKADISVRHTSPMKLFEYMASERPIVASDLPSIREILPLDAGFYFKPDDPDSLAAAITSVLSSPDRARECVMRAHRTVQSYTWAKRAERLMTHLTV
jgi:glycosyltransferase involved in cell wall biosynthesis